MRSPSKHFPPGREKGAGRSLVLTFTIVFGTLLVLAVGAGLWSATADQDSTPAPSELAGYNLIDSVTGAEAIAQVNRLHGTEIDVVDAWIGNYQEGGTVWAAWASSEAKARELLDDMVINIQDGGSPFWGLTREEFEGMVLYSVRDSRQVHFFYRKDAQVVWLAAPPGAEEAFLAKAIREVS